MSKGCRIGHDIIKTGDPEVQMGADENWPSICDRNGEVVLSHCRKCNRGEAELERPCVPLKWATPEGDNQIAYLARVSNSSATPDMPSERLIGFLLRNHHWSPFEMASMCVEINTTRDITAQILRHRSFSFQEFSTRYADVEELEDFRECRFQDDTNRQNSTEATPEDRQIAESWDNCVTDVARDAQINYKTAREAGIAKEVAQCVLPIGLIPSKLYMTGTVRSWLHYIAERTKSGVQKEHREVAQACAELVARAFPQVFAAFTAEQKRIASDVATVEAVRHMLSDGASTRDCLGDTIRHAIGAAELAPREIGDAVEAVIDYLRRELSGG